MGKILWISDVVLFYVDIMILFFSGRNVCVGILSCGLDLMN